MLLAACGSATGSGGSGGSSEDSAPTTAAAPVPAVAPSVSSGATDTTSVVGVGAAPNDTLSAQVVPGPAALTVLGPDGSVRWEAPPTAGFVERDAGGDRRRRPAGVHHLRRPGQREGLGPRVGRTAVVRGAARQPGRRRDLGPRRRCGPRDDRGRPEPRSTATAESPDRAPTAAPSRRPAASPPRVARSSRRPESRSPRPAAPPRAATDPSATVDSASVHPELRNPEPRVHTSVRPPVRTRRARPAGSPGYGRPGDPWGWRPAQGDGPGAISKSSSGRRGYVSSADGRVGQRRALRP